MEKLSDLTVKIAKKHDLKDELDAAFVLQKTQAIIQSFWGTKGQENLKPQKIVFNRLYVQASNSGWAQELQLKKHDILEILKQQKIKSVLELKIVF